MSLLVIGTVAFDEVETPFASSGRIIGGAATYVSLAASYFLKENIHLVSVVGDDFPESGIEHFHKRGISTEGLQIKKGEKFSRKNISVKRPAPSKKEIAAKNLKKILGKFAKKEIKANVKLKWNEIKL